MKKNQKAKNVVKTFDLSKVDQKKKDEAHLFQELFDSGITDMKDCAEKLGVNSRYLYSNLDLYAAINGKSDKYEAYGIRMYNRKPSISRSRSKKNTSKNSKKVVSEEKKLLNAKSKKDTLKEILKETKSGNVVEDDAINEIPEIALSVEDLLDSTIENANKLIEAFEGKILEFDASVGSTKKEESNYEW